MKIRSSRFSSRTVLLLNSHPISGISARKGTFVIVWPRSRIRMPPIYGSPIISASIFLTLTLTLPAVS